jgi:hypothetical protein
MDAINRELIDLENRLTDDISDPILRAQEGLDPESEGEAAAERVGAVFRKALLVPPRLRSKEKKMLDAQA